MRRCLLVLVVVLAVAGCGSADAPKAPRIPAGQRQFSAALNVICRTGDLAAEQLGKPQTIGQMALGLSRTMPAAITEMRQTEALRPPAQLRSTFRRYVNISRHQLAFVTAMMKAAQAGNIAAFNRADRRLTALNTANDLSAEGLGAPYCMSMATGTPPTPGQTA
ncbi:MAG TPA: hypothetical protein VME01_00775 [Solirubrobacteraceae bacterium]|nr:hypothetical protein [Solirubrobacteraceae bacterium]